jgi:AAA family ATP:ADP antiporter
MDCGLIFRLGRRVQLVCRPTVLQPDFGVVVARTRPETEAAGVGIFDGRSRFSRLRFREGRAVCFHRERHRTFFNLEQARLVASAIPDSTGRVEFFSGRDFVVSVATFLIEVFGTARVLRRFGVTAALLTLPLTAAAGTLL